MTDNVSRTTLLNRGRDKKTTFDKNGKRQRKEASFQTLPIT